MDEQATNDLIYESTTVSHSMPRLTKVSPTNGTQTITLSNSSSYGPVEFLTQPNACVNLARSTFQFDVQLGLSGANLFNVISANPLCLFQRIVVSLQTGQILLDLNNVSKLAIATTNVYAGFTETMNQSKGNILLSTTQAGASIAPLDSIQRGDSTGATNTNIIGDTAIADSGALASRLFCYSGSANTANYVSYQFQFGNALKNTILGLDKLLNFGQSTLSIQFYFQNYDAFSWICTAPTTSLTAGQASVTSMTVTNMVVTLCQEANYDLVKQVVALAKSDKGIELPVGYVYSQKTNQTGLSHSIQYQLTQGFGNALNYVVYAPFQNNVAIGDKWINAFNNSINTITRGAAASIALLNYNTYMDQLPIGNNGGMIDVTHNEQWTANVRTINRSMILSAIDYSNNFTHFDNYTSGSLWDFDQTTQQGVSLKDPHIYSAVTNWAANCNTNHFVWLYTNRILKINSAGVQLI